MQTTPQGAGARKSIEWLLAQARAHQGAGSSGVAAVASIIHAGAAATAARAERSPDQDPSRSTPPSRD